MQRHNNKLKIFLLLVISFSLLVGCSKKEEDNAKEDNSIKSNDIYSYKTSYVGDNTKVIGIISNLNYPKNYTYSSIEIKSEKEPYGLIVYLDGELLDENDDFFNQAVVSMSLIENLDNIKFISKESKELIEEFNREDINLILRENSEKSLEELSENKNELDKYINNEKDV